MRRPSPTQPAAPAPPPFAVEVPLGPAVIPRLLPALTRALEGGPAVLPLPHAPAALRSALVGALQPQQALDQHGIALVVPTSGSTGEPKGVLLSAAAVLASVSATTERLGGPGRWLLALPATHVAGLMVLARSVLGGNTPVALDLTDGFDPEAFAVASMRVFADSPARRYTSLVPRQLAAILDDGEASLDALTGYDAVLVGGSATHAELLERARAAGARIVTTYGLTETCGGCVYDGLPLDGVRVAVAPNGRIRLGGPVLASGYRLRPDLGADAFADGWFATADAGRLEPDGRLTVLGRLDDVAVSGGVNVPLSAVDAAVSSHPEVREAVAVAVADAEWGQRIVVTVVPVDATHPPTLESIRTHVARRAPAAYAPKELFVIDALPTLPGGKIDRRAVADRLRSQDGPAA